MKLEVLYYMQILNYSMYIATQENIVFYHVAFLRGTTFPEDFRRLCLYIDLKLKLT